ncbi:hypothetical protein C8Q74DRAFT_253298 [Fomes fomentarius]|nr:hypothetical protein C8Q74DRAFT_253298 [Fomes fomentarius]
MLPYPCADLARQPTAPPAGSARRDMRRSLPRGVPVLRRIVHRGTWYFLHTRRTDSGMWVVGHCALSRMAPAPRWSAECTLRPVVPVGIPVTRGLVGLDVVADSGGARGVRGTRNAQATVERRGTRWGNRREACKSEKGGVHSTVDLQHDRDKPLSGLSTTSCHIRRHSHGRLPGPDCPYPGLSHAPADRRSRASANSNISPKYSARKTSHVARVGCLREIIRYPAPSRWL